MVNMKKTLIIALPIFLLTVFNSPISARAEISQLTKEERREELENRLEERKELNYQRRLELKNEIEERKASQAARLAEARQMRISKYFMNLKVRIEATILRIETLIDRIESRLAKIEETGDVDTTSIHEQLESAKSLLEESRDLLTLAEDELENTLESENPKDAFEYVRQSIHQIRDNLVEVHRILVHVIGDIRGLRVGNGNDNMEEEETESLPSSTPTEIPVASESAS